MEGQRFGPSGRVRPPEACFQDEFYRCFWEETQCNVGISSEWSGTGAGRIDFLVHPAGWGFELLRDGDRIREHCERFTVAGAYYSWILQGELKDWLILDCRHSYPQTKCKAVSLRLLNKICSIMTNYYSRCRSGTTKTVEDCISRWLFGDPCIGLNKLWGCSKISLTKSLSVLALPVWRYYHSVWIQKFNRCCTFLYLTTCRTEQSYG